MKILCVRCGFFFDIEVVLNAYVLNIWELQNYILLNLLCRLSFLFVSSVFRDIICRILIF